MKGILCYNNFPCPYREELRGHDDLSKEVTPDPNPYYRCGAKTLEQMQPCILREDEDLKRYGVKVLVHDGGKTRAWDPKKIILQRHDREETIDGQEFEV